MEMVLQQSMSGSTGGWCRAGPRPAAATAPMMAMAATKQEPEREREEEAAEEGSGTELRRGPWTVDEDLTLINYIADHGEGRWNALARAAGLKRTGKSCRLRWLNYLRPDVKRGDFTADEQLLILDLHSRWGNRWSKIAAQLPGRTDNEIKNYWRTRVQKHAKQLNCDVNSKRFKDAMRFLWMPRLAERAAAQHAGGGGDVSALTMAAATATNTGAASMEMANDEYCSRSSVVTTTTSSSSSLTSESTTHDDKAAMPAVNGDWAAMQCADHEFWSTASALQQFSTAGADHQLLFQADLPLQDLSGWVQGFSEGVSPEILWSLDDIWRMQ